MLFLLCRTPVRGSGHLKQKSEATALALWGPAYRSLSRPFYSTHAFTSQSKFTGGYNMDVITMTAKRPASCTTVGSSEYLSSQIIMAPQENSAAQ